MMFRDKIQVSRASYVFKKSDLPEAPGAVAGPAHAVAIFDELKQRLQSGHSLVRRVSPRDDLPEQHTE